MNWKPETTLGEAWLDLVDATPSMPDSMACPALFSAGAVAAMSIIKEAMLADHDGELTTRTFKRLIEECDTFVKAGIKTIHEKNNPNPEQEQGHNRMAGPTSIPGDGAE